MTIRFNIKDGGRQKTLSHWRQRNAKSKKKIPEGECVVAEKEKCESEKEEVNVAVEAEIYPTETTARQMRRKPYQEQKMQQCFQNPQVTL